MTEMPRVQFRDVILVLIVLATAAGVRAGYLRSCAGNGYTNGPIAVQDDRNDAIAALVGNLKEHRWYGGFAPFATIEEQTAHTAPGYPWLLGWLAHAPVELRPTVRWIQVGLGTLTALLYFLFARRAFRNRLAALFAGLLVALHPFYVVNVAELDDGVLSSFLLALVLFLGARTGQEGGAFSSLLYGLTLAGLALVRATMLPFAVVGLLWFLLRCRTLPRGWLYAFLAVLGFANGLAPWTVRNLQVVKDVVPITDTAWLHLWIGNSPGATGGPNTAPAALEALAAAREQSWEETANELASMPQHQRYQSLAQPVLNEIRTRPLETVQRRINAGLYFVFGSEWFRSQQLFYEPPVEFPADGTIDRLRTPSWVFESCPLLLTSSLFGMVLLGLIGWRWSYGWRRESMPMALAVLFVPLPYMLSHAEQFSGPRLPLDGVLLCLAGFTLVALIPGFGRVLREVH